MDQERLSDQKLNNEAPFIGITIELLSNEAIVLAEGGDLFQINKKPDLKIGEKIYFFEEDIKKDELVTAIKEDNLVDLNERAKSRKKLVAKGSAWLKLVASLAAVIMIFYFGSMPKTISAYAIMSIDINPSINMTIDKVGSVIKVKSFNADADKILKGLNIKGKNYDAALADIFLSLTKNGYDIKTRDILIAVAPLVQEGNELALKISDDVVKKSGSQTVQIVKGDLSNGEAAEKSNVSLGRKLLEQENPEINEKEIEDMPVKDLFKIVPKKIKVEEKESDENDEDEQINDNNEQNNSNNQNKNETKDKDEKKIKKDTKTNDQTKVDENKDNKNSEKNKDKKTEGKKTEDKKTEDKKTEDNNNGNSNHGNSDDGNSDHGNSDQNQEED